MAILNNLRRDEYNRVQNIINEVLINRKFRFDIQTILDIIKRKSLENNISKEFLNCSYFYILVLNTLDRLVDEGKFYKINSYYIPVDFIIYVEYVPTPYRLLYFISDNNEQKFIDIVNLNEVCYDDINGFDLVLCGGGCELVNDEYQVILQTDVSLEEISNLYHELVNEGASSREAMVYLLNYYRIQIISYNFKFINEFVQNKPQIKKLSRKKIIH